MAAATKHSRRQIAGVNAGVQLGGLSGE